MPQGTLDISDPSHQRTSLSSHDPSSTTENPSQSNLFNSQSHTNYQNKQVLDLNNKVYHNITFKKILKDNDISDTEMIDEQANNTSEQTSIEKNKTSSTLDTKQSKINESKRKVKKLTNF